MLVLRLRYLVHLGEREKEGERGRKREEEGGRGREREGEGG